MASSPKLFTSILILTLLFIQIHARESKYFFSKIPNNNVDNNNNNNFDAKETQIPNDENVDPLTNPEKTTTSPQDQQPNFIPQTQDNGYGLYGHESGQLPPNSDSKFFSDNSRENGRSFTTTTTYDNNDNKFRNDVVSNYKSESEEYYNYEDNNNNNNFQTFENSNSKPYENSFYYNKDLYDNGRQSFQNTRLSRDDYTTTPLYDQGKYDNFYNSNNGGGDNNNNGNNMVRQGMSDTRFMENGKYYYDLDREPHHYSRSRGYFGNNINNNNNRNSYEYGNSMGRYQNQNDEAEFQEEPNEFVP